jgi:dockerin type I repeat protein
MRHVAATGRLAIVCSVLLLLSAPAAWAVEYVVDFESGNPFSAGALVVDQAASGVQSLYLAPGTLATLDIPAELLSRDIVVTMMVFDQGRWIDRAVTGYPTGCYGPRWGVSGLDATFTRIDCAATIIERTSLASDAGYGFSAPGGTESRTGSWYSPQWFGWPRQCTLSPDGGSNDGSWVMGTPGTGRWTRWTFNVAATGEVTLSNAGSGVTQTHNLGGSADQLWLFGGRTHATVGLPLAGVWIDDVRIWAADPLPLDSTVDFEGVDSNPFSGGIVSTDYAASGTQSLYLEPGDEAFLPLEIPGDYVGDGIQVTMTVFDLGKWIDRTVTGYPTSCYGPRWGVSGGESDAAITILETQYLTSGGGYGHSVMSRFVTFWHTYGYYGGPRQCTLSANGGTNDGSGWVMGTEGTGAWTTWTFQIDRATNEVACARDGGAIVAISAGLAGPIDEIWMWGGGTSATSGLPLAGVYIDDITLTAYTNTTETIEVTAVADFNWVYPNTPVTTHTPPWTTYPTPDPAAMPNHYATITIDMTTGGADTYTIVIDQDGGVLTDFSVRDATQLVGWDGAAATTVDVAGGLDTVSTPGSYTLNVNVTGDSMGGVDSKPVTMKLRVFADVDDSGSVDTTDKLEINRELNGIAVTPGITPRMLDLTGNSAIDTNDKLQVNRVLNGLLVP